MASRVLDPDGVLRVVAELCAVLRRQGMPIAPPELMDATRALAAVGLDDRATVQAALASTLVKRLADRAHFDEVFDRFFDRAGPTPVGLFDRLRVEGFTDAEISALAEILAAQAGSANGSLAALLGSSGGGELARLLMRPDVARALEGMSSPLQIGFYSQRIGEQIGLGRAASDLALLRATLRGALGERGDSLADALQRELERARGEVRTELRRRIDQRTIGDRERSREKRLQQTPFTSLGDDEVDEVRRAVRRLAEKLRGKARVRRRRDARGTIDLRRTLRLSWKTSEIPIVPVRRRKRRDRPRLLLLCDVSDSVRLAARFLLELVYALAELFSDTRSFVFVSEVADVSDLLKRETVGAALAKIFAGQAVSLSDNSNYGRMLLAFHKAHLQRVDRRTTVVVLGDGRNNYQSDEAWVLADLRRRARAVVWINPERRASWAIGDSAMSRYAPACTRVLEVSCAAELEAAARLLVSL